MNDIHLIYQNITIPHGSLSPNHQSAIFHLIGTFQCIIQQLMLEVKCEEKFTMGSAYDYNKQIQTTLLQSVPTWIKAKCSIRKIIRNISNLTKLNPLQACLLSWLLSKSKFEIERISLSSRTNIVEEQFDHKVLVFMLLNGYYVKKFVCQNVSIEIDDDILSHIPDFKVQYDQFNPQKSLKTLSLSDINRLFSEWTCRRVHKNKADYNNLVDKILYLSKTYNVSAQEELKEEKLGLPRKKRKKNQDEGKSDLNSYAEKEKSLSNQDKRFYNRLSNSLENGEFISLSQQNPFKREEPEMGMMRRSTRNNMLRDVNIYDLIPSQDNLFNSQMSNNGMFNSSLQNSLYQQKSKKEQKPLDINGLLNSSVRLRQTSSFDLK